MNYPQALLAVFLGLLVVGAGYVTIGGGDLPEVSINNSQGGESSNLDYEHTYTEHGSNLDVQFEEAPSYIDGVRAHNKQILKNSYELIYTRSYNDGGSDLHIQSNPADEKVHGERELAQPAQTMIQEIYYVDETQHMRIRPKDSSTDEWQYEQNLSDFETSNRTAFSELRALELSGLKFEHSESITKDGITYFVYEPVIVDEKEFTSNRFVGEEDTESSSIEGEVLLSEYGIVTSAQIEYAIGDTDMTVSYSLEDVGDTTVEQPVWVNNNDD